MEMDHCEYTQDEMGKKYPKMMHHMMDKSLNQLRMSIPTLKNMSNDQIMGMMRMMGPNYFWPVSNQGSQNYGVLIMAHGYGPVGDLDLFNSVQSVGELYQTTLSMGMSMMTSSHVICSVNEMIDKDVEKIFVVPVSSTAHNTLVRQWNYIFNLEEQFAYSEVERIANERIVMLEPINDDIYAKKIILEYTNEISSDPANEVLIIIAHGPIDQADNEIELRLMNNIGEYIKKHSSIQTVESFTLQDDAPKTIRDQNLKRIKAFMNASNEDGKRILMVSNLMSGKGIQKKIEEDFEGIDYTFNPKGLLTHPYYIDWIKESVANHTE
ncbi:MAG: hypothetical protein CMQ73_00090 [Gammaproteobacteria bacterium]|nr:hypothetical protein [Gammaproteobacteria bacterium]OUT97215.1 MAG: hypothetical protein CBB96_00205 [Gammaproteobacteria bacterium TMED36]|tara:strand:- start:12004 stop:12975 length:972 start_codon:yes stop_codon:yes gene_type:complete